MSLSLVGISSRIRAGLFTDSFFFYYSVIYISDTNYYFYLYKIMGEIDTLHEKNICNVL